MGREDRRARKSEGKGREAEIKTNVKFQGQECSRKRRDGRIVRQEVETLRTLVVEEGVE